MKDVGRWSCLLLAQETQETAEYSYDIQVFEPTSLAFSARPHRRMAVGAQVC